MAWVIESYISPSKAKKFENRHIREFRSLLVNLRIVNGMLDTRKSLNEILATLPFLRSEGGGIYRIGQTFVISAKESRLYVSFDFNRKKILLLNIGIKETQSRDLTESRKRLKTYISGENR